MGAGDRVSLGREVARGGLLPWTLALGAMWNLQPRGPFTAVSKSSGQKPGDKAGGGGGGPRRGGGLDTEGRRGGGPGEGGTDGQGGLRRGLSSWQGAHALVCQRPRPARESEGPTSRVSALDPVRGAVWTPPRGPCGMLPKRETASLLLFARWWVFLSL